MFQKHQLFVRDSTKPIPNKSETTKLNILFFTGANNSEKLKGETEVLHGLIIMVLSLLRDSPLWLSIKNVFGDMHSAPRICIQLLLLGLIIYGVLGRIGVSIHRNRVCNRNSRRR